MELWLFQLRWRELQRRRNEYWAHTQLSPQRRDRKVTKANLQRPQHFGFAACQGSHLLDLPPEIRLLIWEFALGGNHVALYLEKGHLVHVVLDDTNTQTPAMKVPIQIEAIEDALKQLPKSTRTLGKRPPHTTKMNAFSIFIPRGSRSSRSLEVF